MQERAGERFVRQIALPGFGVEGQRRLASSRVLVIGAGGLGSAVIPALAAAGVGTIGIIDDDRVETSNLHRQLLHGVADVGRSKVESALDAVATLSPDTQIVGVAARLVAATALELFAGFDLVVDGSDTFPTRYLTADAAELTGIPLVWGSVSQYGGQVGVSTADLGYRDLFPTPPAPGTVLSCEVGGVLPTVVATVGSIMASEVIKILTGIGKPLVGRVVVVDALAGTFDEVPYARDPSREPVTGLIDYELFCGLHTLTPAEVAARSPEVELLDVREPWEAEIASIEGSRLIPLGTLEASLGELDPTRPVIAYCHHGVRSAAARDLLASHGFSATHLAGGIDAWARDLDPAMARY